MSQNFSILIPIYERVYELVFSSIFMRKFFILYLDWNFYVK